MIEGSMRHKDSTGGEGLLGPGSIQWMTAGKGIVHSEMPEQIEGRMQGFQLWVNLPAKDKMCPPRYQDIDPADVPETTTDTGATLRVLAGTANGVTGPINGVSVDPLYIDVKLDAGGTFTQAVETGHTCFVYAFEGAVKVQGTNIDTNQLGLLTDGTEVTLSSEQGGRVIVVAGKPIGEPIARYGPFVMNTKEEISQAINDFQSGNFL